MPLPVTQCSSSWWFQRYNQTKMDPWDAKKTTFQTPIGNFHYKVMSFSLKNVGATYQRAMIAIFAMILLRLFLFLVKHGEHAFTNMFFFLTRVLLFWPTTLKRRPLITSHLWKPLINTEKPLKRVYECLKREREKNKYERCRLYYHFCLYKCV